jgi:hypothetical protein
VCVQSPIFPLELLRAERKERIFFLLDATFFCPFCTNLDETIALNITSHTRTTPRSTLYHTYRTEKPQSAIIHSTKLLDSSFLVRSVEFFSRKMKRKIRGATESEAHWLDWKAQFSLSLIIFPALHDRCVRDWNVLSRWPDIPPSD